jgi:hypothetical protein
MRLVNYSHQLLHVAEVNAASIDTPDPKLRPQASIIWLPVILLVTVIATSLLLGVPDKPREELDWLSQLANKGDAGAQLQLGLAYKDGRYGISPDTKTGLYWIKRSAAGGNPYAEDIMGTAYAKGLGMRQDIKQAEHWWRKAVNDGAPDAKLHLADALLKNGQTREANQLLM